MALSPRNATERRAARVRLRLKKVGNGVLLLPSKRSWDALISSLGQFSEDFMAERDQPEQQDRSEAF